MGEGDRASGGRSLTSPDKRARLPLGGGSRDARVEEFFYQLAIEKEF